MRRLSWYLPAAGVLALGACFLTVARARDDDEKEKIAAAKKAAADVEKLADAVGKPDELKKEADAVAKKYEDLGPIMWQFKPAEKGGMQIGKQGTFQNDSIELGLLQLGKKSPSAKDITAKAADLTKLAQVSRGIAEVTPSYAKKYAKTPKDEKDWNGLSEDMKKASDDLAAAIKGDDDKAFKTAVNHLNTSCNDCHTKFRDN